MLHESYEPHVFSSISDSAISFVLFQSQIAQLYLLIPHVSNTAREHRNKERELRTTCSLCIISSAVEPLKQPESFLLLRPAIQTFREIAAVALHTTDSTLNIFVLPQTATQHFVSRKLRHRNDADFKTQHLCTIV